MGFISKNGTHIAIAGLVLVLISIAGILYVLVEKEGYLKDQISDSDAAINYSQILEGNHSYDIEMGVYERTLYGNAAADAEFILYVDGVEMLNEHLYDFDLSESGDSNRAYAYDVVNYYLTPTEDVNVTIVGEMLNGDYWSIDVYQDVPPEIGTHFIIVGAMLLVSVVIMLSGFCIHAKDND